MSSHPTAAALNGAYIGQLNGTLFGPLFAQVEDNGVKILRFRITLNGNVIDLTGAVQEIDSKVVANLKGYLPNNAVFTAQFSFDSIETLSTAGRWEADENHGGVFTMQAANTRPTVATDVQPGPTQIIAREGRLPRLRLIRPELIALIEKLRSLVDTPAEVIITASIDGNEMTLLSNDFLARDALPSQINSIRLGIAENKAFAPKAISVVLSNRIESSFSVSSDDESWVNGTWMSVDQHLRRHYSWFDTSFQKYGLNLNFIVFLVALTVAPSILSIAARLIFVGSVLIGMFVFKAIHDRINHVRIYPNIASRSASYVDRVQVWSAIVATVLLGAAGWLFSFLQTGGLADLAAQIAKFLQP